MDKLATRQGGFAALAMSDSDSEPSTPRPSTEVASVHSDDSAGEEGIEFCGEVTMLPHFLQYLLGVFEVEVRSKHGDDYVKLFDIMCDANKIPMEKRDSFTIHLEPRIKYNDSYPTPEQLADELIEIGALDSSSRAIAIERFDQKAFPAATHQVRAARALLPKQLQQAFLSPVFLSVAVCYQDMIEYAQAHHGSAEHYLIIAQLGELFDGASFDPSEVTEEDGTTPHKYASTSDVPERFEDEVKVVQEKNPALFEACKDACLFSMLLELCASDSPHMRHFLKTPLGTRQITCRQKDTSGTLRDYSSVRGDRKEHLLASCKTALFRLNFLRKGTGKNQITDSELMLGENKEGKVAACAGKPRTMLLATLDRLKFICDALEKMTKKASKSKDGYTRPPLSRNYLGPKAVFRRGPSKPSYSAAARKPVAAKKPAAKWKKPAVVTKPPTAASAWPALQGGAKKKPAGKKPIATKKPVAKKPIATKKPVAKKPVAKKPAAASGGLSMAQRVARGPLTGFIAHFARIQGEGKDATVEKLFSFPLTDDAEENITDKTDAVATVKAAIAMFAEAEEIPENELKYRLEEVYGNTTA